MARHDFLSVPALGIGLATIANDTETVLDVWFGLEELWLGEEATKRIETANLSPGLQVTTVRAASELLPPESIGVMQGGLTVDPKRGTRSELVTVVAESLSDAPLDTGDAYLRLHLLSHRLVQPHTLSMDGIFGVLPNVAWTSAGPCPVERVDGLRLAVRATGHPLQVFGVDKFPRMLDYVVPSGVRIADADRVRLGAYLAAGTTVMHEGFVNFHAGTLGASMIEGRISAGVVIGDGSDVGGGASIMGTLSGGGKQVISVGERCLLGANSGLGISLGDGCVIEAGCYITAGSKVRMVGGERDGQVVKAAELSGASELLFRRNSISGTLEVLPRTGGWEGLNTILHTN